jgi:hypothetical protein
MNLNPPGPQRRFLEKHGCPICLMCGALTNPSYAKHPSFLVCWSCGNRLSYSAKALELMVDADLSTIDVEEWKGHPHETYCG